MCSIAGYYNPKLSFEEYKQLNLKMAKRGPDFSDVKEYFLKEKKLFLAHNRLSILDLSPQGNQPMESEKFSIVFNGEIYNHLELRNQLKQSNFTSSSDTQTLLYAFEEWGIEKTINKLNGMFAIGLFDKVNNKFYLIRDRMGVKPLYYTFQNNEFAFASTILGLPPHLVGDVDDYALIQFLSLTYIPSSNCYYKNIKKVQPATFLEFDGKSIVQKKYWSIPDKKISITYNDALNQTKKLLEESVQKRLLSDVPVGVFLSGGIDSSLVASIACRYSQEKINTFTIGFLEKKYDESGYAKEIAKYLKTDHKEYIFTSKDVLDLIFEYKNAYDEPFGDASSLPMMLLSKFTSKKVKVALSGDGGDELFLGYDRYKFTDDAYNKLNKLPYFLRSFLGNVLAKSSNDRLQKISYPIKNLTKENLYSVISTALKPWEVEKVFNKEFLNNKKYSYLDLLELDESYINSTTYEDFSKIDQIRYLPDDIMTKVDRATMYYSLEAREPLLDYNLVEFANSLPLEFRKNKKILKDILNSYIPQNLTNRPKRGFSVPLKKWFRDELKDLLFDKINSLDARFNKTEILKLANEHIYNNKNYEYIFWNLLQVVK